jgi:hypothetical protein
MVHGSSGGPFAGPLGLVPSQIRLFKGVSVLSEGPGSPHNSTTAPAPFWPLVGEPGLTATFDQYNILNLSLRLGVSIMNIADQSVHRMQIR